MMPSVSQDKLQRISFPRHRGVALFQVLLICVIFAVLLTVVASYTQQSIGQAQQIQEATHQRLALYSAANYLKFQLLTQQWLGQESGETRFAWNFYGHPFRLNLPEHPAYEALGYQAQVSVQDHEGMLSLTSPPDCLEWLLQQQGKTAYEAGQMRSALVEGQKWLRPNAPASLLQEGSLNLTVQHPSELLAFPGWTPELIEQVASSTTTLTGILNPAQMPDALLPCLLPEGQVDIIKAWRQGGEYSIFRFSSLTRIVDDEVLSLYPGAFQRLTLADASARHRRQEDVRILTYTQEPLTQLGRRWSY
jgi:hypothetical protein